MSNRLGQHYNRYDKHSYDEYNKHTMDNLKINTNNKNATPLSLVNESDITYTERTDFIVVASQDRDITNYPNPSHYVVKLPHDFRNVSRIEIVNGVIPDQNNVIREPYLLLKIEELENVMVSNNQPIGSAFAMLHMAPPIAPGYFINVNKTTFEHVVLNFKTPKASLSKLTISITDYNGDLFDFGDDSGGPNKALQNMFVLKIVTLEKSRDSLNVRNVF
jgi:hypothetical protein